MRAGRSAGFAFLDLDNPDDQIGDHARDAGRRHRRRKVAAIKRLLSENGVMLVKTPKLRSGARQEAAMFGRRCPTSMQDLIRLTYKQAPLGTGVASSLISLLRDSNPDLVEHRDLLGRYLLSVALLQQYRPGSVLIFNGRFACVKPIAEAACAVGIPYLFHERGATRERYQLFHRSPHDFEYIRQEICSAWDHAPANREEIAHSFFRRRRGGDGIGGVSFTGAQETGHVPSRALLRRLVYFTSSDDEFEAVGDFIKHPLFESQRQAVCFLVSWVGQQENTELVIRIHPHLVSKSSRDRDWWESLNGPHVLLVPPDSKVDSYALAETADVALTYGSTMGIEASYWGKPVILLGDAHYRGFGCVYEPKAIEAVCALLAEQALSRLPQDNCLPYAFYTLTFGRLYEYYRPSSLVAGEFLGKDLLLEPAVVRKYKAVTRKFKRSTAGQQLKKLKRLLTPSSA